MRSQMVSFFQLAASAVSISMMGAVGVQLMGRLIRVFCLRERADGLAPCRAADRQLPLREMGLAAGAAFFSRILVYLLAYAMMRLFNAGDSGVFESLERLWLHWDTRHYMGIAESGYTAVGDERLRLVFFPLYPLLMRAASLLTGGNVFFGGLLVSLLCTMIASALLCDLGMMHGGRRTAALCVAYFLLSPMSMFLNCAYTEALFIALTLGAVCLYRRKHPWLAALCGAASALTRMPGVIIAGLPIIALIAEIPKRRIGIKAVLSCAGQVLLIFSGLMIYWGINYIVTGDPFTYLIYQKENWYQEAGSFWESAATTMYYVLSVVGAEDWFFCWVTQLAAMFVVYALLLFKSKALPFDLAAYSFVYVAVVLSPTWLLSGPRYLYALCALPLLKANMIRSDTAHGALLAASAALLVLYTFGYTLAIAVL